MANKRRNSLILEARNEDRASDPSAGEPVKGAGRETGEKPLGGSFSGLKRESTPEGDGGGREKGSTDITNYLEEGMFNNVWKNPKKLKKEGRR